MRIYLTKKLSAAAAVLMIGLNVLSPGAALAASAGQIDREATQSLNTLYQNNPGA